MIADAQRIGDYGERRVPGADRDEETGIDDIKVIEIVSLAIEIERRCLGDWRMSLTTPDKIRTFQRKLYCKAKAEPAFRFYVRSTLRKLRAEATRQWKGAVAAA